MVEATIIPPASDPKLEMVNKRVAAIEVYKESRYARNLGILGLMAMLFVMVLSGWAQWIVALLGGGFIAYLMAFRIRKMNDLNKKYELGFKEMQFKPPV